MDGEFQIPDSRHFRLQISETDDSGMMADGNWSVEMKNGSTNGRAGKARGGNGHREPAGSLEGAIMGMARRGELAVPARLAIRRLRRKGVPITFRRGQEIIKQHADGREEVLGVIELPAFKLPKGVRIIEGT